VKRYRVKLLGRAKRELAAARTWWLTYRHGAPNALRDELRVARELLARNPEVGRIDEDEDSKARRLLLPTTRYVLFYRVDHAAQEVRIVAIWHATSREAPEL
jgi:plasmid stabilization system protein ParE